MWVVGLPEFVLDYHRFRVPIDHPDGSITPLKLSFGVWQKVAEVDVPSGTTAVTISDLDGDADKAYLIYFEGALEGTATADWYLVLIPNALSLTIDNVGYYAGFDGSTTFYGVWRVSLGGFMMGRTGWLVAGHMVCLGILGAMTGYRRQYIGWYHIDSPGKSSLAHHDGFTGGFWNDTTTKITSLKIATSTNTFSGKIILFKVSI
jgi:hypothetical protein